MSRGRRKVIVKESTGRRLIEQSRIRLLCVGLFFALCFGSIVYRMVDVVIISNDEARFITVSAPDELEEDEQIEAGASEHVLQRGDIVDRHGNLLATSLITASVFANPKEISDTKDASKKLAPILRLDENNLLKQLDSKKTFVWIKRNLTPKEQQNVNSLGIPGVYFLPEEKRVYPYGNLTAHVLGYVGLDNKGLAGMEKHFDRRLRDKIENGEPLQAALDIRLQSLMHEELSDAVKTFRALGGVGVILDLQSDEIVSMVSLPDFDPNQIKRSSPDQRFNRATLGVYEMGSTFKTFTMALGLEYGGKKMTSGYDASKPFKLSSFTIRDSHPKSRWLSVPEIYAYSSNIGTAKMALDVGGARQKEMMRKLGMFEQVDIELPERGSPLYPSTWKDINTVTISYGHGISVTPLHLLRGIGALVNGGTLPQMTLLKEGKNDNQHPIRIISEETSENIRRLMRIVVMHGTGSKSHVAGYHVGGKTGTAEKVQASGRYDKDAKMASFIATFPVDNPRYVILVMVDEPKGNKSTYGYATGGWIAAPVVGNVINRMGPLLGIKPRFDVPEDDADKFWVEKKPKTTNVQTVSSKKESSIHATSY